MSAPDDTAALAAAWNGDEAAFAELFGRYRKRLKRTVKLRLDRRLAGRIDADDVLQAASNRYVRALKRMKAILSLVRGGQD